MSGIYEDLDFLSATKYAGRQTNRWTHTYTITPPHKYMCVCAHAHWKKERKERRKRKKEEEEREKRGKEEKKEK